MADSEGSGAIGRHSWLRNVFKLPNTVLQVVHAKNTTYSRMNTMECGGSQKGRREGRREEYMMLSFQVGLEFGIVLYLQQLLNSDLCSNPTLLYLFITH